MHEAEFAQDGIQKLSNKVRSHVEAVVGDLVESMHESQHLKAKYWRGRRERYRSHIRNEELLLRIDSITHDISLKQKTKREYMIMLIEDKEGVETEVRVFYKSKSFLFI